MTLLIHVEAVNWYPERQLRMGVKPCKNEKMISYSNHTWKALLKRRVAPLETEHASHFPPQIFSADPFIFSPLQVLSNLFSNPLSVTLKKNAFSLPQKNLPFSQLPPYLSTTSHPFAQLCPPFLKQLTHQLFSSYFPSRLATQGQLLHQ